MAAKTPANSKYECQSIRQLIVYARAKNGWTHARAAKALKTSPTTVKAWERGQKPKVEHYQNIARVCGVPVLRLVLMATAEPL